MGWTMLQNCQQHDEAEAENDEIDQDFQAHHRAKKRAFYIIMLTALLFTFAPMLAAVFARLLGARVL